MNRWVRAIVGSFLAWACLVAATSGGDGTLRGRVTLAGERPAAGALVTVRVLGGNVAVTRSAGGDGSYTFSGLVAGRAALEVRAGGRIHRDTLALSGGVTERDLVIPADAERDPDPSATWLGLLPDGEEKRRFVLDCTGCHLFDAGFARARGKARTRAEWKTATERMLRYAGATSGFPVIAADRDTGRTADWLARHVGDREPMRPASPARRGSAEIVEYDLPEPADLPHDLAVERDGRVIVTGMFTTRMYLLDPATGTVRLDSIPVERANPRAVEIDERGDWWVVLGGPGRIARREARTGSWQSWPVGVYAHSIALGRDGNAWVNGHFTRDPELLVRLDPRSGDTLGRVVPPHPRLAKVPGGPVPYELRAGPDGRVWLSELQGNRIVGFDPNTGTFTAHELPESWSGPRRFDVDAGGALWIPAYSGGALLRLDPATGKFESFALPTRDAAPYVARVDRRRGTVWIGTAAADEIFAFDPRTREFTAYPLPTRGALVRHLVVDEPRNEVWAAYGASPGLAPARVARLRPEPG